MRNCIKTLAAAIVVADSLAFIGIGANYARAQDQPGHPNAEKVDQTLQRTGEAAGAVADAASRLQPGTLPPGIQKTDKDDASDIRSALAKATGAAVAKKDLSAVVERFVDADRNRLEPAVKKDKMDANLAGRIQQIQDAWKAKYNQDFDVPAAVAFGSGFQGFMIAQGEIANPALLSNWPVQNGSTPESQRRDMTDRAGNKAGDRNLEKGRNVAVVTFPAENGLPELNVSLIHEMPDSWQIDVPDNLDGQKLADNLSKQLTAFGQASEQWPADVNQGYRLAAHYVLMAMYDVAATPANAVVPWQPGLPAQTDKLVQPGQPGEPAQTDKLVQPGQPGLPAQPDRPAQPGQQGNQDQGGAMK